MPGLTGNASPKPRELALRLLLAGVLLAWLAHRFGREAAKALLPLIGHALAWLDDHYRILLLAVDSQGADTVIRLRVTLARPLLAGGRLILPDARERAEITTPVGTSRCAVGTAAKRGSFPAASRCEIAVPSAPTFHKSLPNRSRV